MGIFRSIVLSAALAGLLVGMFVTLVQHVATLPLILEAESYEGPGATTDHVHAPESWQPADGLERNLYTALFNVIDWIGFGLLLGGGMVLLRRPAKWREGFLWGLGAFLAFVVAPGLGLPPELPGAPEAPLLARQLWWGATVLATTTGLCLIAFCRSPLAAAAAIALIAVPHLVGAPRPENMATDVPELLSRQFIVAVTLTALPCWALLGGLTGHLYGKFSRAD
jgi:cobalt transporter subunit CbtA